MSETLLSIKGVAKHFDEIEALSHIDLDIRSGEVVGLVGSNGAGKTTTFRMLTGDETPTRGKTGANDIHSSNVLSRECIHSLDTAKHIQAKVPPADWLLSSV